MCFLVVGCLLYAVSRVRCTCCSFSLLVVCCVFCRMSCVSCLFFVVYGVLCVDLWLLLIVCCFCLLFDVCVVRCVVFVVYWLLRLVCALFFVCGSLIEVC